MTGVGETTGVRYTAVGNTMETFTGFIPATGDGTYNYIQNFQLVSSTGNFLMHTNQRFTIFNSGNNLTIYHDDFVVQCN